MFGFGKKDVDLDWHGLFGSYVGMLGLLRRDNINVFNAGTEGITKLFIEHLGRRNEKMSAIQVDDVVHANIIYLKQINAFNDLLDILAEAKDRDSFSNAYENLRLQFASNAVLMAIKSA
jgi:hypothetical protein